MRSLVVGRIPRIVLRRLHLPGRQGSGNPPACEHKNPSSRPTRLLDRGFFRWTCQSPFPPTLAGVRRRRQKMNMKRRMLMRSSTAPDGGQDYPSSPVRGEPPPAAPYTGPFTSAAAEAAFLAPPASPAPAYAPLSPPAAGALGPLLDGGGQIPVLRGEVIAMIESHGAVAASDGSLQQRQVLSLMSGGAPACRYECALHFRAPKPY